MFGKIFRVIFGFSINYKPQVVVTHPPGKDKTGKPYADIALEVANCISDKGMNVALPYVLSSLSSGDDKGKWNVNTIGHKLEISIGFFWIFLPGYLIYRLL